MCQGRTCGRSDCTQTLVDQSDYDVAVPVGQDDGATSWHGWCQLQTAGGNFANRPMTALIATSNTTGANYYGCGIHEIFKRRLHGAALALLAHAHAYEGLEGAQEAVLNIRDHCQMNLSVWGPHPLIAPAERTHLVDVTKPRYGPRW